MWCGVGLNEGLGGCDVNGGAPRGLLMCRVRVMCELFLFNVWRNES
jgi:hypothetical protein